MPQTRAEERGTTMDRLLDMLLTDLDIYMDEQRLIHGIQEDEDCRQTEETAELVA